MDESQLTGMELAEVNLGIVCPMANERDNAQRFVKEVLDKCVGFKSVKFFVIFDNACKDGTFDLLKDMSKGEPRLEAVWAPEDRCVVDAYVRGYKEAVAAKCDWILEIDAGFSHRPQDIRQFFDKMAHGYDCVFGSRFVKGASFTDAPLSRYIISRGGSMVTNLLLGTKLKDMTSGFELFKRQAMEEVLAKGIKSRGHFFQTEIKVYCRKMKVTEVPIHYSAPSPNVNSKVLKDAFGHLLRLFKERLTGRL